MAFAKGTGEMCHILMRAQKSGWGVADDWSSLSSENAVPDTDAIFDSDLAADAAREIEVQNAESARHYDRSDPKNEEDSKFIHETVDFIHHNGAVYEPAAGDPALYDTASSFESYAHSVHFLDKAGEEIGLLVRCNKRPEELLIQEGRALAPLTTEERDSVDQLVKEVKGASAGTYEPTDFLVRSVSTLFHEHSVTAESDETFLDAAGVASWMTKSLGSDESGHVGAHDKRVMAVISRYGTYGTGQILESELLTLYLDTITSALVERQAMEGRKVALAGKKVLPAWKKELKLSQPTIENVWRDFRNHGIISPVEEQHAAKQEEINQEYGILTLSENQRASVSDHNTLMDECEILGWSDDSTYNLHSMHEATLESDNKKSSFELVELASDNKTPKWIRDGEFVFIDEETCIGCGQCAAVSPASFVMMENGRARTYVQRHAPDVPVAVSTCPVSCMHNVAFHELKEMEKSRDSGDGRLDHRHMGQTRGHTPLNVAGIDSDANHKSSWYHYLKQKCHMSKSCPQRGCYDCPFYSAPGENPYFQERNRKAEKVRANDIINSGEADMWRKMVEL